MSYQETTIGDPATDRHAATMSECPECLGAGHTYSEDGTQIPCWRCGGTGQIPD